MQTPAFAAPRCRKLLDGKHLEPFLTDADPEIVRAAAEAIARDVDAGALLHHPEVRGRGHSQSRAIRRASSRLIGDVEYDHELIRLAVESRSPKVRAGRRRQADEGIVARRTRARCRATKTRTSIDSRAAASKKSNTRARNSTRRCAAREELVAHRRDATEVGIGSVVQRAPRRREARLARQSASATRAAAQLLASHGVAVAPLDRTGATFRRRRRARVSMRKLKRTRRRHRRPPRRCHDRAPPAVGNDAAFATRSRRSKRCSTAIRRGDRDGVCGDRVDTRRQSHVAGSLARREADHRPPPEQLVARFHAITHNLSMLYEAAERRRRARRRADAGRSRGAGRVRGRVARRIRSAVGANSAACARPASGWRARSSASTWPSELPRPQRLRDAGSAARPPRRIRRGVSRDCTSSCCSACTTCIGKLEAQIDAGNLASAAGLEGEGKRLLHSLPAGTAKRVQSDFVALSVRVQELKDWRTFATHPKREQFLGEMEKLAAEPLQPTLQAERIRELRQAWKDLGPVTNHNDRRLFDRFNHAAEIAFKPCREHFDAQAAARKFNLEQRRKICAELEGYLDGIEMGSRRLARGRTHSVRGARRVAQVPSGGSFAGPQARSAVRRA